MGKLRDEIDSINERVAIAKAQGALIQSGEEALAFQEEKTQPFADIGLQAAPLLGDAVLGQDVAPPQFEGFNLDPGRVTDNPLFQALRDEQTQQIIGQNTSGFGGSGGTRDAIARQNLLLGNQFQQQDVNRQQLGFQNQNQIFQNRLQANQNRFGQIFDQVRLGSNVAVGQGTSGSSILQNLGNVNANAAIANFNARPPARSNTQGFTNAIDVVQGFTGGGIPDFNLN
jgi:hypothetical protein